MYNRESQNIISSCLAFECSALHNVYYTHPPVQDGSALFDGGSKSCISAGYPCADTAASSAAQRSASALVIHPSDTTATSPCLPVREGGEPQLHCVGRPWPVRESFLF